MNMHFIAERNPHRARSYFLRVGTSETDTSLTVLSNLAAGLSGIGDSVDSLTYWDAGHGANQEPATFMAWANRVAGHTG
jgi:hypothetical protein